MARWEVIPGLGRTLSGMSVFPVDTPSATPGPGLPSLGYRMYAFRAGRAEVNLIVSPSLNFVPGRGLRVAAVFDGQVPRVIDVLEDDPPGLADSVRDGVRTVKSAFQLAEPGYHTLKVWIVDPGVVSQKLVIDLGGLRPSYLGPPESFAVR